MKKTKILGLICLVFFASCKKTKNITDGTSQTSGATVATVNAHSADIIIYGATASGVMAAVEAKSMGKSVILISNSNMVGGITSSGLSNTDIGDARVLGGLARDFYTQILNYYKQGNYVLEPKVALMFFKKYISDNNISIYYNERLLLNGGVIKSGTDIQSITMESGAVFSGKEFIDASYEGDLMAKSGVNYVIGRDGSSKYGEEAGGWYGGPSLNIDPYVIKGNAASGLLPFVNKFQTHVYGAPDGLIQAYCYRLCMTKDNNNKVMVSKPGNYNAARYELLFRMIEANPTVFLFSLGALPNNKVDVNNNFHASIDDVGANTGYPDGDYATRDQIIKEHKDYEQGLVWALQNDTRLPLSIRSLYSDYGLAKDEFTDNNNWPPDLYIREGRRMVGDYVTTQTLLDGKTSITDPIGMGSYSVDSHGVSFFVNAANQVAVDGEVYFAVKPYGISYHSIVPKKAECTNLLVPVCLSASRIAFCSIRMEPQYMILGQSAGAAASLSIDLNKNVQDLDYTTLKARLLADKQVLTL